MDTFVSHHVHHFLQTLLATYILTQPVSRCGKNEVPEEHIAFIPKISMSGGDVIMNQQSLYQICWNPNPLTFLEQSILFTLSQTFWFFMTVEILPSLQRLGVNRVPNAIVKAIVE